jgi:hypothetical protein
MISRAMGSWNQSGRCAIGRSCTVRFPGAILKGSSVVHVHCNCVMCCWWLIMDLALQVWTQSPHRFPALVARAHPLVYI